jgi:hypothetical protein
VGLPLAALALALFVMSMGNGVTSVHAATDPSVNFSLNAPGCSSSGTPTAKCNVPVGSSFVMSFNIDSLPSNGTYAGYDSQWTYTSGLTIVGGSLTQTGAGNWPDCAFPASDLITNPGQANAACGEGINASESTYVGALYHISLSCGASPSSETITLNAGDGKTDIAEGPSNTIHSEAADESLTINCAAATATPTTPPTATPPPQPRVQKDCDAATAGVQSICNVFLHRQGAKVPPARCEDGTDVANLSEGINIPISSQDPKGVTGVQQLAAFEFEVRFDPSLVCVSIAPGVDWTSANGAICSALVNEGLIRFGCVTTGKNHNLNATVPADALATISVRPQEELYSLIRPNQDNGIPVQILNQGCELADEQGHPIPIFSCEDADLTFRFLEGDVDGPDCDVDVLDAQQVAFRWGATLGSLLYTPFMDLEPSGQTKGDGDIDIKDLQFVFGRLDSTCTNPWPPQPPVNPKA